MDTNFEQKVRERAYHLWLSAGGSAGAELDHWLQAEQALSAELHRAPPAASTPRKATGKVTAKTKKPTSRRAAAH